MDPKTLKPQNPKLWTRADVLQRRSSPDYACLVEACKSYLWLVGNGRMVVLVIIIVPHSSNSLLTKGKKYMTWRLRGLSK